MKKPRVAIGIDKENCAVQWHYATGQVESLRLGQETAFNWVRGRLGLPSGMCYLDKRETIEDGIRHVYGLLYSPR